MRSKRKRIISLLLIILFFTVSLSLVLPVKTKSIDPFFTIIGITRGGVSADYLNMMKDDLMRIGINLDVIVMDWSTFIGELLVFNNFDLAYLGLSGGGYDPDFTGIYNENGTLNLFGYHTSMDWDEGLGTGINEWYMREGTQIMPPNSQERIQHYWEWQDYLMDKICPMLPTFSPKMYVAYWSNLVGYNYSDGILKSWGKMSWDGNHNGQENSTEIVITDAAWSNLNPLFQHDSSSRFISEAIMDPLFWCDYDLSVWPHLAESFTHINDTHVQIKVREGIKWDSDRDGNYTNEYLDIKDVFFTLYCWKHVSDDQHLYDWIEDMVIVDDYTMDLFIDGNSTTEENELYSLYLQTISVKILPEHYLNQTQLADNVTPNITHASWDIFKNHAFGTGLFKIKEFKIGNETILEVRSDCWRLNTTLTNDPALDWENRFGDFSGGLNQLRIRIIPYRQTSLIEFEAGKIDIDDISWILQKRAEYAMNPQIETQSDVLIAFGFVGYNMRENRPPIGSRNPCPGDPSLTVGLAIRKAISYAIDLVRINNVIHGGSYEINYTPMFYRMGIWNNPNIIHYDHDLDMAIDYMYLAGYDIDYTPTWPAYGYTSLIAATTMFFVTIFFTYRKKKTADKN